MSLLAALWAKVGMAGAAIIAAVVAVLTILSAARRSGRVEAERDTIQQSLDAARRSDEAGADYRGDGATKRLRDGTF